MMAVFLICVLVFSSCGNTGGKTDGAGGPGTAAQAEAVSQPETAEPAEAVSQPGTAEPAEAASQSGTAEPAEAAGLPGTAEQAQAAESPEAFEEAEDAEREEAAVPSAGEGADAYSGLEGGSDTAGADGTSLREFCKDPEMDAWFEGLEENVPVQLDYWVYGEGPYNMIFTDRDLILKTARALETVKIGGVSAQNPDNVADAGGAGYYFTMQDGSKTGFTFMMGTYRGKDGKYHDVAGYGDLTEVSSELHAIANPEIYYAYSEDDGFYTTYLGTYRTEWKPEEDFEGGLSIYTATDEDEPYVEIGRYEGTAEDPEIYLTEQYLPALEEKVQTGGGVILETDDVQPMEFGAVTLPGVYCTIETGEDTVKRLLVLALQAEDTLIREQHIVRFCALWDASDEEEQEEIMEVLDRAVREFHLKHMYFEETAVQPENTLPAFCNSEELNTWLNHAQENLPDSVTMMTDTWYMSENPDTIRAVLAALQEVRIGEASTEIVGAAGRRIYTFADHETGDYMEFCFFKDYFEWENTNYQVLDWGSLKDYDETIMKDHEAR